MTRGLRTWTAAGVLVLAAAADLRADLRFTVRIETRKSAVAVEDVPAMRKIGRVLLEQVAPDGQVELTYLVGEKGVRVEWSKPLLGLPAGSVLLRLKDGTTAVLNPADRTYWKLGLTNWYALGANQKPLVTAAASTTSEMVAGISARRSRVDIRIPFLQAQFGLLVLGTPKEFPLTGEVWTTDQFARDLPAALRSIVGLATLGFDVAPVGDLVLRQVIRGPMFGDQELESRVTALVEENVAADRLEIPSDFKEIPRPPVRGM